MVQPDVTTEIRLADSDEAARFNDFIGSFLSANDFPFVIIHNAPELSGSSRRVLFEDAVVSRKFAREWTRRRGALGEA
ncbi:MULTISPECIES: hypothetical protein [unclassified Caulobacter]|uniref:hypothetical protein n=1 Tax=unclassified Caulobacter TaxID=2648921 RepID=UPI000D34E662|nr:MULTISPECIES: hypothetical protein [unclassified Caulobacter]PTS87732.1 hypothetical protein DBR21_11855 [Caulobacter sp. HMWF009]PTT12525.1 hypothetical protein DBR10_01090 [Caulobacter sp. HMWF025]